MVCNCLEACGFYTIVVGRGKNPIDEYYSSNCVILFLKHEFAVNGYC